MVLMIIIFFVLGLIFGSFTNAVTWRVHEQETELAKKKPNTKYLDSLSIRKGRSMCSNCHHELGALDLIPVLSWVALRGMCRYCKQPIPDSPWVEVLSGVVFALSYLAWPVELNSAVVWAQFATWLVALVGLVMLSVYDLRWMLLPNRILLPTGVLGGIFAAIAVQQSTKPLTALLQVALAVAIGGGIFFVLFQVSNGKWIGGGDVKLGWVLGLFALTPAKAVLFIFLAAVLGTIFSLPLVAQRKLDRKATIPFGPFLILGLFITVLWGSKILHWYTSSLLLP